MSATDTPTLILAHLSAAYVLADDLRQSREEIIGESNANDDQWAFASWIGWELQKLLEGELTPNERKPYADAMTHILSLTEIICNGNGPAYTSKTKSALTTIGITP